MYFSQASAIALTSLFQFLAVSGAPILPRATQSPSYASLSKPILSPYYLYFGNSSTPSLASSLTSLNLTAVTIGFGSAPAGQCALTSDLNVLLSDVQAFIGEGGTVSLSFGGNLQDQTTPRQHIQQACTDVPSLTALIESAMSKFNTYNIEFDIEDNQLLSDTAAATRLGQALVQVKKDFPNTYVTYTVGANPTGLPDQQLAYVQAAQSSGLTINALTLMTMNMGGTNVVQDAQTAVLGAAAQLEKVYELQAGLGIKRMGILPSIGVDNSGQVVDMNGIATITAFAKSQGLSILSYWSFNRDFPGDVGSQTQSLADSSSPDQTKSSQFFETMASILARGDSQNSTGPVQGSTQPIPTGGGPQSHYPPLRLFETSSNATQLLSSNAQPGQKPSLPGFSPSDAPGGAQKDQGSSGESTPLPAGNSTIPAAGNSTVAASPSASVSAGRRRVRI